MSAAAPWVFPVGVRALALTAIRLALAVAGEAAAFAAGAEARAGWVAFAFGAGVSAAVLGTDRRWLLFERQTLEPLPDAARHAAWPGAITAGLLPSTAGVAVLSTISLAVEPVLSAVLAGILAGMSALGLLSWLDVAVWERRERSRLFADTSSRLRLYYGPR